MARATVRVDMHPTGASIHTIARELRKMDDRQVKDIFRRKLADAARPYPARVRASVLAIPTKPGGKHTGLRARIAQCVQESDGTDSTSAWASIWMNPFKMLPDYTSLPLYMQGAAVRHRNRSDTRWRHPVYGHSDRPWVQQASHPYFYQAASPFGRAAGEAIRQGLDDITRKISG